jgi:hypothetical protein
LATSNDDEARKKLPPSRLFPNTTMSDAVVVLLNEHDSRSGIRGPSCCPSPVKSADDDQKEDGPPTKRQRRSPSPTTSGTPVVESDNAASRDPYYDEYYSQFYDIPPARSRTSSEGTETEDQRRARWDQRWLEEGHDQPPRPDFEDPTTNNNHPLGRLEIEYWDRSAADKERKQEHLEALDQISARSREEQILSTTLLGLHVNCEPNMFPYETPRGVSHYTLWSRTFLVDFEVETFMSKWLCEHVPQCTAWAYDPSNLYEGMSVDLYHVHVFLYQPPGTSEVCISSKGQVLRPPVIVPFERGLSHRAEEAPPSPPVGEE